MKTVFAAMITCLALFGMSVGATKFLLEPTPDASIEPEAGESDDQDPEAGDDLPSVPMPVSLRPESTVTVEAIIQMSDSIKKMEQELIEREKRLIKKEQRIKLLHEDLLTEQEELTALNEGIDVKVDALYESTNALKKVLADLESKKQELEKLEKETGSDDASKAEEFDSRMSSIKSWFDGMPPEQAATYLKEFANSGKIERAAALLQKMPARQQSKILAAMDDPILADQLIEAVNVPNKRP